MSQSSPQSGVTKRIQTHVSRVGSATASALSTALLQRRRVWIGPVVTAAVILLVGWWANRAVEREVKTNMAGQLQALLNADVAALQFWLHERRSDARALAESQVVRQAVLQLHRIATTAEPSSLTAELLTAPAQTQLRDHLAPFVESRQMSGYVVIDVESVVLAREHDTAVGDRSIAEAFASVLAPVFGGETIVAPPILSMLPQRTADGGLKTNAPVMFAVSPVRSGDGDVVAALCVKLDPEKEFTGILQVAQPGASGETYAFNRDGLMVTGSRFDSQLKAIGLLPDEDDIRSVLHLHLRDPGVDLTRGGRSAARRSEQPLTRMAQSALAGEDGVDVNGYADYRGVQVVGAWRWLPEENIGVATEMDAAEAFEPLNTLRTAFGALIALLLVAALGLGGLAVYAAKLELQTRRAVLEAKRLGQYTLGEPIGSGGMGVVYRAHHDLLQRPTAVKLLHVDKTDEQAIARFEREVQLTSQLTHPNTIAIYDYGRTPEGVFFYAMEYLDGVSLQEMVTRFGPLDEARVIHVLRQVCGSLAEAHQQGLVHRDVKPANIMLTRYGGMYDFAKLLDFGLVKSEAPDRNVTLAGFVTGTPLYMAPEAIQQGPLDGRTDLYALGAVGYFLWTGRPLFDCDSVLEICNAQLTRPPTPPSQVRQHPLDPELERILLRCLAKRPEDRPADAYALEAELAQCRQAHGWSRDQAAAWWRQHLPPAVTQPADSRPENDATLQLPQATPRPG